MQTGGGYLQTGGGYMQTRDGYMQTGDGYLQIATAYFTNSIGHSNNRTAHFNNRRNSGLCRHRRIEFKLQLASLKTTARVDRESNLKVELYTPVGNLLLPPPAGSRFQKG